MSVDENDVRKIVREEVEKALDQMDVDESTPEGKAAKALRRDVLKSLGAVGVGAGVGAGAMGAASQEASAGSQQTGTIGSGGSPVDVVAEDIYGPGGQGSGDSVGFESLETDQQNNTFYPDPADDAAGIQQAVDDADPGDTIYLREGTYDCTTAFSSGDSILVEKALRITGSGQGSLLFTPDGTTSSEGVNILRFSTAAAGAQVDNIAVDGNKQNNGTNRAKDGHAIKLQSGNILCYGNTIRDSTGDGIAAAGDNTMVFGNDIRRSYENNIHYNRGENCLIYGNTLEGEDARASLQIQPVSNGQTIESCAVVSNTVIDSNDYAIMVLSNEGSILDSRVANNTVSNPASAGIRVRHDSSGSVDCVVESNTVKNGNANGLRITQSSGASTGAFNAVVRGNFIRDNQGHGVFCELSGAAGVIEYRGNTLLDNNTNGTRSNGIYIKGNGHSHDAIICKNNEEHSINNTHDAGVKIEDIQNSSVSKLIANGSNGASTAFDIASGTVDYVRDNTPTLPVDVRNLQAEEGNRAYHNGSGDFRSGLAFHNGSGWIYLGGALEQSNADNPQGTYEDFQVVDFVDTGDNSGNGLYMADVNGDMHKIGDS